MKELVKSNIINETYQEIDINGTCVEYYIVGCPNLSCVCDGAQHTSIENEDILF